MDTIALRPRPVFTLFYVLLGSTVFVVFAGLAVASVADPAVHYPSSAWALAGFVLFAMVALFGAWLLLTPLTMKLVLNKSGLEYHTLNYILRVPWRDVNRSVLDNGSIMLVLPDIPQIQPQPWFSPIWPIIANERIRVIPVGFFALVYGHGFTQALQRVAPRLLR